MFFIIAIKKRALTKFNNTNMEDGLQLDMECDGHPRPLEKYIEAWQI